MAPLAPPLDPLLSLIPWWVMVVWNILFLCGTRQSSCVTVLPAFTSGLTSSALPGWLPVHFWVNFRCPKKRRKFPPKIFFFQIFFKNNLGMGGGVGWGWAPPPPTTDLALDQGPPLDLSHQTWHWTRPPPPPTRPQNRTCHQTWHRTSPPPPPSWTDTQSKNINFGVLRSRAVKWQGNLGYPIYWF